MKKFRRAFLANPNARFDVDPAEKLADELVYVCSAPMFDDMSRPEHTSHFEGAIVRTLKEFDPDKDVVVLFGDPMIGALIIYYLAQFYSQLNVARFSMKKHEYIVRKFNELEFEQYEEDESET
jgi:hypothetical protein